MTSQSSYVYDPKTNCERARIRSTKNKQKRREPPRWRE